MADGNGTTQEPGATPPEGNQTDPAAVTPNPTEGQEPLDNQQQQSGDLFADLDADTREWLAKREIKDPLAAAKLAHEQSKLLGNAVRVPGKDAKPEEVEAFYEKLGRPKTADEYDFKPPENLPEDLPYDGERAKSFAGLAHKIGLTKAQAAAVHDWAASSAVEDYKSLSTQRTEQEVAIAKGETEKLVKLWGPLDGETMKINLSFADKALREVGGDEALAEFQRVGLIGSDGAVIKSAPIAVMLAKMGQTLYKEDDVLRGRPDRLNNPFADGKDHNVTAQMKLIREDREQALTMIAAAGKKPEDFGLKA